MIGQLRVDLDALGLDSEAVLSVVDALGLPLQLFNLGLVCRCLVALLDRVPWLEQFAFDRELLRRARPGLTWVAAAPQYQHERGSKVRGANVMRGETREPYRAFTWPSDHHAVIAIRAVLLVAALARHIGVVRQSRGSEKALTWVGAIVVRIETDDETQPDDFSELAIGQPPRALTVLWGGPIDRLPQRSVSADGRAGLRAIAAAFDQMAARFLPVASAATGPLPPIPPVAAPVRKPPKPRPIPGVRVSNPIPGITVVRPRPRPNSEASTRVVREGIHWSETVESQELIGVDPDLTGGIEQPARIEALIADGIAHQLRDQLLLPTHWNTLTDGEYLGALDFAFVAAEAALASGDRIRSEAATLVVLNGVCGRSVAHLLRSSFVRTREPEITPNAERDVFGIREGTWRHALPDRDRRYRPKPRHEALLDPVEDELELSLPSKLAGLLRGLDTGRADASEKLFKVAPQTLHARAREIARESRQEAGSRITLARLRRTVARRVFGASGDLSTTMFVLGDSFGLSTVGCNYYSARTADLQIAFEAGMADGFPDPAAAAGGSRRVGSRLCVRTEAIAQLASSLRIGLIQSDLHKTKSRAELAEVHNRLVIYTLQLLAAAVGHRQTQGVLALTRRHVSLRRRCAVVNDKELHRGHRGRLCALGTRATAQIASLLAHYEAIGARASVPGALTAAIRDARDGSSPLFFLVDSELATQPVTLDEMRERLPDFWTVPWNALRHRAATGLRELGCPAEYVAAQLGHLEFGIQPFGIESPASPEHFLETTGRAIDQLLEHDGWKLAHGLAKHVESDPSLDGLAVSRDLREREAFVEKEERELANDRRRAFVSRRASAQAQTVEAVERAIHLLLPETADARGVKLDEATVGTLRSVVISDVSDDADQIEWRINALRAALRTRRANLEWSCPLPHRAFQVRIEPSPFLADFCCEVDTMLALRDWFVAAMANGTIKGTRAQLLLAGLVILDANSDREAIFQIAQGVRRARTSTALPDALVVPLSDEDSGPSTMLRGTSALLALQCMQMAGDARVPSADTFERWLASVLPKDFVGGAGGKGLLESLLALADVFARFSFSGVERAARQRIYNPVPLAADRMLDVVDGAPPRQLNVEAVADASAGDRSTERLVAPMSGIAAYQHLRRIIYVKKGGAKRFGSDSPVLPAGTPEREIRDKMIVHLQALRRAVGGVPTMVQALVEYAHHLTVVGTPLKPDPAFTTVYKYVVDIGIALVRQFGELDITLLAEDDFISRYELVAPPDDTRDTKLAEMVLAFHKFLVQTYGVDAIDPCELLPTGRREASVDANVVTIAEYLVARDALIEQVKSATEADDPSGRRLLLGALVSLILTWRSSCRFSEVTLRRFADVVDGGRALLLRVRPNQFGRLKSISSKRVCNLTDRIEPSEIEWLRTWIDEQKALLGEKFHRDLPLFPEVDDPTQPMDRSHLAEIVNSLLRWATGSRAARTHWMRHSGANYDLMFAMADADLLSTLGRDVRLAYHRSLSSSAGFRRALAGTSLLSPRHLHAVRYGRGHRRLRVTMRSYIHLLPVISAIGCADRLLDLPRASAAVFANVQYANLRKLCERSVRPAEMRHRVAAVLIDRAKVRTPRVPPSLEPWHAPALRRSTTVRPHVVASFLTQLCHGIQWDLAVRSHGLSLDRQRSICEALARLYRDWPQSWFAKATLLEWAERCGAKRARLMLNSAPVRTVVGPARSWLDKPLLARVLDYFQLRRGRASIAPAAIVDRRLKVAFFADISELSECCTNLVAIGFAEKRIAIAVPATTEKDELHEFLSEALGPRNAAEITWTQDSRLGRSQRSGSTIGLAMVSRRVPGSGSPRRHIQTLERILVLERLWLATAG